MSIRNAAKALIIDDGKILLNKCESVNHDIYYTVPGGGQIQQESMEEAVQRECFEETGYRVKPVRFAALYEEIVTDADLQKQYPDYTHKIYHIFLCALEDRRTYEPTERDSGQITSQWIPIEEIEALNFHPQVIKENILSILHNGAPVYLGTVRQADNPFLQHRQKEALHQ